MRKTSDDEWQAAAAERLAQAWADMQEREKEDDALKAEADRLAALLAA